MCSFTPIPCIFVDEIDAISGFHLRKQLELEWDVRNKPHEKLIIEFPKRNFKVIRTLEYAEVIPGFNLLSKLRSLQMGISMSIPSMMRFKEYSEIAVDGKLPSRGMSVEVCDYSFHNVYDVRFLFAYYTQDLHQDILWGALIKIKEDALEEDVQKLKQYINEYSHGSFDYEDFMVTMKSTNDVMDIVFSSATYVALFLCLFSVISSMYVNIYEQSKEVAVLRSIGLSKFQTYKGPLYKLICHPIKMKFQMYIVVICMSSIPVRGHCVGTFSFIFIFLRDSSRSMCECHLVLNADFIELHHGNWCWFVGGIHDDCSDCNLRVLPRII